MYHDETWFKGQRSFLLSVGWAKAANIITYSAIRMVFTLPPYVQ